MKHCFKVLNNENGKGNYATVIKILCKFLGDILSEVFTMISTIKSFKKVGVNKFTYNKTIKKNAEITVNPGVVRGTTMFSLCLNVYTGTPLISIGK